MPTIAVTTANICCNPRRPQPFVRRRIRRASRIPGVTFGQEIELPRYTRAWRRQAKKAGKRAFALGHEVPISVPRAWLVTESSTTRVHGGLEHVSPHRIFSEVIVELGGLRVSLINCHPVSKPRPGVDHAQWRMDRWEEYRQALRERVALRHAQGLTVIVGGDMNKTSPERIHRAQVRLARAGLDHLWVVPAADVTAKVRPQRSIPRTRLMDHPILIGTVVLTRKATA